MNNIYDMELKSWNKIGVGISEVHQFGIFCIESIKRGEVFEICPILIMPLNSIKETNLMDYVFSIDDEYCALGFGNASLYNHNKRPNAKWDIDKNSKTITFTSKKDIKSGDEIFISYGVPYWNTRDILMK